MNKKLMLLYVGGFLASAGPLLCVLIFNWDKYTKTPSDAVRLTLGGIIILVLLLLKVLGKLRLPRRIVLYSVVLIMSYLLQAVLDDLNLLVGMALLGECLDYIFFERSIRKEKRKMVVDETAIATAEQVEKIINNMGRV